MVLSNLSVEKLYGNFDYNVKFNSDITLLYGTNGCGKTTILNIITAIITGKLYQLFLFKFNKVELKYYNEVDNKILYTITILMQEEQLKVSFKDINEDIIRLQNSENRREREEPLENLYFEKYFILNEIRKEFNYVYLALNRATSLSNRDDFFYRRRHFMYDEYDIVEPERVAPEIRYIEGLISKYYRMAVAQINVINEEFRNAILKSTLDINKQVNYKEIIYNAEIKNSNISKICASYLNILSDLKLVSEEEKEQYKVFFDNYEKKIRKLNEDEEINDIFELFLEFNQIEKIQRIVDIAEDAEKRKAVEMSSIELFIETVNDFIVSSDYKKKIGIDINGRVYFSTGGEDKKLSVQYLSSGERQILIFFANLIFGVKNTSSGIFVVDEPELSLHLSWQKVFVKKALEINNKVQFIFATHSPEIIGSFRNKTEKLKKLED